MGLDTYFGGVILVTCSAMLAVGGLLLTRRLVNLRKLRSTHEVGGSILQVVGTLYAVLLGLIVVDAMGKFQSARDVTEREANSLADVFILSSNFPEPKRTEVKNLCISYAGSVMGQEWADMRHGAYSSEARRTAVKLLQSVTSFEPITENQKALYPLIVADASDVWENRRSRINIVANGIPCVEWTTLIVGGCITVFFTYFFGLESLILQVVMTAMVAMLIALNMYLVLLFGYPFSGDLSISTEPFRVNQGIFENHVTLNR